ncbi:MAG: flavin reductase family protein [Acetivibrionales bacterium]
MDNKFYEIRPEQITDNTFKLIGSEWMLITAGRAESYNTMTASWGGFGVLWHKNICFCVVRPTRYTYEFMERSDTYTLSFFDERYKKALEFCGSKSGRDVDKAAETGLTPVESENKTVFFDEARLVIECRKLYFHDIDPKSFIDPTIENNYPKKDYHRMYVGEIIKSLAKK